MTKARLTECSGGLTSRQMQESPSVLGECSIGVRANRATGHGHGVVGLGRVRRRCARLGGWRSTGETAARFPGSHCRLAARWRVVGGGGGGGGGAAAARRGDKRELAPAGRSRVGEAGRARSESAPASHSSPFFCRAPDCVPLVFPVRSPHAFTEAASIYKLSSFIIVLPPLFLPSEIYRKKHTHTEGSGRINFEECQVKQIR